MLSTMPDVVDASRAVASRMEGLRRERSCSGLVTCGFTAAGAVPLAGELTVFCRPVVTDPAVVRRDGTVLAGARLPDLVRLGELERRRPRRDTRAAAPRQGDLFRSPAATFEGGWPQTRSTGSCTGSASGCSRMSCSPTCLTVSATGRYRR